MSIKQGAYYNVEICPNGMKYIRNKEDKSRILVNKKGLSRYTPGIGSFKPISDDFVTISTDDGAEAFYEYQLIKENLNE